MTWLPAAEAADETRRDTSLSTNVAGVAIVLVRSGARWFAIEDRCSHADCAFSEDGEIDGLIVVCDCHGSEFDVRTGAPLVTPATEPIRTFPVRVVADRLEVQM